MGEQFGTTKSFVHLPTKHVGDLFVSGPVEISDLLQLMHFLLETLMQMLLRLLDTTLLRKPSYS